MVATTADPGTSMQRSARKRALASTTSMRPRPVISRTPSSPVGPWRCLPTRNMRRAWWPSPSKLTTVSTTCSNTRGPARVPSLVTCPTSTIAADRARAWWTSHWAESRTWATLPGAEPMDGSLTVWTESTTHATGPIRSSCPAIWPSSEAAVTHRSSWTARSRSARWRTWASDSSADT